MLLIILVQLPVWASVHFVLSKCFKQRHHSISPCIYVQYIGLHFPPTSLFHVRRFTQICTDFEWVVTLKVFPFLFGSLLLTRRRCRGLLLHLITHVDTHTHTHTHTWTHTLGGIPLGEESARCRELYLHNTQHKRQIAMLLAGLEPAIPTSKRAQTYAFDHTATGIGIVFFFCFRMIFLHWGWVIRLTFWAKRRYRCP